MYQFCPVTVIARTTQGTHYLRISAQTVKHRLREIGERPPYTMCVLYAAFLFWPSIYVGRVVVYNPVCQLLNNYVILRNPTSEGFLGWKDKMSKDIRCIPSIHV